MRRTRNRRHGAPDRIGVELVAVGRHGRAGLLRTTALQAVALFALACPGVAQVAPNARPQGGQVVGGAASINQSNPALTAVRQGTQRAAIDWRSFDVGSKQTVTFTAPRPSDVTLNRVTSPEPSQIAGHIVANDQLVIVNQSGVVFSRGSEVNAAGLVVSAAGIQTSRFMAGSMNFDQSPHPGARIENDGHISVAGHGLAALVAPQVANAGTIEAPLGHVVLAGAAADTVDLYGDGMLSISVTKQVTQATLGGKTVDVLVTNTGAVRADGGTVELTARAVDGLVTNLVSSSGKVSADTVGARTGLVLVRGMGGAVIVTGRVSAAGRAAGETGGQIEVNATRAVTVAGGASLDASGRAGGGTIAVGTTLARARGGPKITPALTAASTTVAAGARLSADATERGAGGHVTVLSGVSTDYEGSIAARGGPGGGDGGMAEVSGATNYVMTGAVDLTAAHGARGSLLLDPTNLSIVSGAAGTGTLDGDSGLNGAGHTLAAATPDPKAGSTVTASQLAALGATSDLTLQASIDLTVSAPVSVAHSLTLQAGHDLIVNAIVTSTGGSLTLAAASSDPTGALRINDALNASTGMTLTAGSGGVALGADAISTSGTIALQATGGVTQTAGTLQAPTVDFTGNQGGVSQTGGSVVAGTLQGAGITGAVALTGAANQIATLGTLNTTGGGLSITSKTGMTVTGLLSGDTVSLTVDAKGGVLELNGGGGEGGALITANAGSVTLAADQLALGPLGGSVTANSGTVLIAPFTTEAVTLNGAGATITLPTLTTNGVIIGVPGGASTISTLQVSGPVALGATPLDLETQGAVSQTAAGTVTAGALTGQVGGLNLTTAINAFGSLGTLTSTGAVALTNSVGFSVDGTVQGASIALAVTGGGALQLGGGEGGAATLSASGGGTISLLANTLTSGGAGGSATTTGIVQIAPQDTGNDIIIGGAGATVTLPTISAGTVLLGTHDATSTARDITFATAADFGAAMLDLEASRNVAQSAGVTAATVSGTAGGSITLTDAGNAIGALGPLTAQTGALSVIDGQSVTVTAGVSGTSVALTAAGAISQSAGIAPIAATGLLGTATLTAGAGITLGSAVNAPTTVTLAAGGDITETASGGSTATGLVNAGTLTGSASGAVLLDTAAGNGVGTLGAFSAGGALTLLNATSFTVAGAVRGGSVLLTVGLKGGVLTLGDLLTSGAVTATGAGTASLEADGFALGLAGGSVSGRTVEIAPFSPGTAMIVGGLGSTVLLGSITSSTLRLGEAGGVTNAGAISFEGPVNLAGETLDLEAKGAVSQTAGGGITAATLTGSVGILDFASAGAANAIAALATLQSGGAISLAQSANFTVNGAVQGTSIALTVSSKGGALQLGDRSGAGTLDATGGGAITLSADALAVGNAASAATTTGTLQLAPFTTGTDMAVNGGGFALPALSVGTLRLGTAGGTSTARNVAIDGAIGLGAGALEVDATGDVTQTAAGGVTAASFGGTMGALDFTANGAVNHLAALGTITTTAGALSLTDAQDLTVGGGLTTASTLTLASKAGNGTAGALTVTGKLSGSSVSLSAADAIVQTAGAGSIAATGATGAVTLVAGKGIAFGSAIAAPATVTLTASGGDITETAPGGATATGTVTAATLTGSATGAAALNTASGNLLGTLAGFTAGTGLTVLDGQSLTVAGAVSGSGVLLTVGLKGGVLTLGDAATPGAVTAIGGGTASLEADGFALGAAGGSVSGSTVEIAPFTSGTAMIVGGPGFTVLLGAIKSNTLRLGEAGGATTAGSITFAGPVSLAGETLDTEAIGLVSQTATGAITAGTLIGQAGALDLTASAGNMIGTLGGFATHGGGFALTDERFSVAGTVQASGITLRVDDGGALTLGNGAGGAGVLNAPGGAVTLLADRLALGIAGGSVTGSSVEIAPVTPGTAMVVNGAGASYALPTLTTADLILGVPGGASTAQTITIGGPIDLPGTTLDVEAIGLVGQTAAGSVSVAALTGTAGSLDFATGAADAIPALDAFTATSGSIALTTGGGLALAGDLSAALGRVTLTASGGALTQAAGLSVVAGPAITLVAKNDVAFGGTLQATGVALTSGTGAITETASLGAGPTGSVIAALLTGTAGTNATFDTPSSASSGNRVAALGLFTAHGGFTLLDGAGLTLTDALTAATGNVLLTSAGSIAQDARTTVSAGGDAAITAALGIAFGGTLHATALALTAQGGSIAETAPGGTLSTGVVNAALLTGSASAAADFATAGNLVNTLGDFTAGTSFTLNNGQALALGGNLTASLGDATLATSAGAITQGPGFTLTAGGNANLTAAAGIAFGGTLHATGVTLIAQNGDIAETAPGGPLSTGVVSTALLSGSATGSATFGATGNQIAGLGSFTAGTTLTLLDGEALAISGNVTAGTGDVALTTLAGAISQAAGTTLHAGGNATLISGAGIALGGALRATDVSLTAQNGDITETAPGGGAPSGIVQAALLTGFASGAALFDDAGNQVMALGPFTAGTSLALSNAQALALAGDVTATVGTATLTTSAGGISQAVGTTLLAGAGASLTSAAGIAFGGTLHATDVTLTARNGDVAETAPGGGAPTGIVLATSLSGSASGAANFGSAGNQIAELGPFTAGTSLAVLDGQALAITADVTAQAGDATLTTSAGGIGQSAEATLTAGGTAALTAATGITFGGTLHATAVSLIAQNGDITETAPGGVAPSGIVNAILLTGSASGSAFFDAPNNMVGTLGAFTAGTSFTLSNAPALIVGGNVTATTGDLTLTTSTGGITQNAGFTLAASGNASLQSAAGIGFAGTLRSTDLTLVALGGDILETVPSGAIQAALLTGSASGSASFGGLGNLVASLGKFAAGGSIALQDGESLLLAGPITAATGDIALTTTAGVITQGAGGSLSAGGATVITSATGIAFGGTLQANHLTLIALNGDITETAPEAEFSTGRVLTMLLAGSASGAAIFDTPSPGGTGNAVAQLGAFATHGGFTLQDGETLQVSGPVASLAGAITVSANGAASDFGNLGSITAATALSLSAGRDLTQAGTATGATVSEAAGGAIHQSGATSALGGDATLLAGTSITQTTGSITANAGAVTLTAGAGITFGGTIAASGTAALIARGGDIVETAPGRLLASLLTGSATGAVVLETPSPAGLGNQVQQLGAFAAGNGITLLDGESLSVTGPVAAGSGAAALTASGDIANGGTVTSAASVTLAAAGNLSQSGLVTAPTLTETAGGAITHAGISAATGGAALLVAGTSITQPSGVISATGGTVTLTAQGGAIDQSAGGVISDATADVALTAATGIAFGGTIAAQTTASLVAMGGDVSETPAAGGGPTGIVLAGIVTGSASGALHLDNASGNRIATLGSFTAGRDLVLTDGSALLLAGQVSTTAGAATITVAGAGDTLGVSGSLSVAGGPLILSSQGGSVDQFRGSSISALDGPTAIIAGAGVALGGRVGAATLSLVALGGDITETAPGQGAPTGTVSAALLTGSASGSVALDTPAGAGGNAVVVLGAFVSHGDFTLDNATNLAIGGPVSSAAGNASLSTIAALTETAAGMVTGNVVSLIGGAGITLGGTLHAGAVSLASDGGGITEANATGVIQAALLTGSAAGQALLNSGRNTVDTLGAFRTGGGFTLVDAAPLAVSGAVFAGGPATVTTAGGLTQPAGSLSANGQLTLTANGGAIAQAAGALIHGGGGAALTASRGIDFAGTISTDGTATMTARGGDVVEAQSGALRAVTLTGSARGQTVLANEAANEVGTLGGFTSGGGFSLRESGGLTVTGPLSAQRIDIETPATVTIAGGQWQTASGVDPGAFATLSRGFPGAPGTLYDIYVRASGVTQTGLTLIDPGAPGLTFGSQAGPTLRIDLIGPDLIRFDDLRATGTQVYLLLNGGFATGHVDVGGLHLNGPAFSGGATLFGTVANRGGVAAAAEATISVLRSNKYRFNGCPIASVSCVLLSPVTVPITNPIQDVEVGNTDNARDDPDLILPDVGEQDY